MRDLQHAELNWRSENSQMPLHCLYEVGDRKLLPSKTYRCIGIKENLGSMVSPSRISGLATIRQRSFFLTAASWLPFKYHVRRLRAGIHVFDFVATGDRNCISPQSETCLALQTQRQQAGSSTLLGMQDSALRSHPRVNDQI